MTGTFCSCLASRRCYDISFFVFSRVNKQKVKVVLEGMAKKYMKFKNVVGFTAVGSKNSKVWYHCH